MLIDTWDWDLLNDELEVKMTSAPAAEVAIDTEVKTQLTDAQAAEYAGGSGTSGAGGGYSYSGGGGLVFFEAVEENADTVGALALYDLYIDQDPTDTSDDANPKNISEILRHLTLHTSGNTTYLVADIPLGSYSQVFSGGIGSGGGGGTGGSIATLSDVTLTSLSSNQVLLYNASSSHWENRTLATTLLTDVSTSTPQNGQVLVYMSATGLWTPTTLLVPGGSLSELSDTAISSPSDGQVLIYSSSTQKWANGTVTTHTHSNKSTLDDITSTKVSHWDTAYSWGNHANAGYLSGAATSSALGGIELGFTTSAQDRNYAVALNGSDKAYVNVPWTDTVYTHPTGGANTTISAASGRVLSAITVDSYGHTTSVSYKALTASDIPALAYLSTSGGTLTGDLRLQSGNYGLTIYFGDSSYAYIQEASDDNLTMYGRLGLTLLTSSSSYSVAIGSSGTATPLYVYGTADIVGNTSVGGDLTVGASSSTSSCKTLTVYGRTSNSYPAITIYGVENSSTRYSTSIYRDSSYLQITSSVYVAGNIVASGQVSAGSASDRRLKAGIKTIDINDASDVLAKLRPVEFDWNDKAAELGQLSGHSRGFIADEYLEHIPGAGRKIWGEYDAIDYNQAIPYIVAAWQAQNLRIRILEGEMQLLREDNISLRRRLG